MFSSSTSMANEMMAFTTNKKSNKRYGTSEKHVNANQSDESVFSQAQNTISPIK